MPWLYSSEPHRPTGSDGKGLETVTAEPSGSVKRSPVRIHAPPNERAMMEPPLGQVSSLRPAGFVSEELFFDPSGALVRTCVSSPDKDWARRMPHRPWCNASEPPYQFNNQYNQARSHGSPVKAARVQDGSYYAPATMRPNPHNTK